MQINYFFQSKRDLIELCNYNKYYMAYKSRYAFDRNELFQVLSGYSHGEPISSKTHYFVRFTPGTILHSKSENFGFENSLCLWQTIYSNFV